MISKDMKDQVKGGSAIRAMFEEGAKMAEKYGADKVFDFSIGNPSLPAPKEVNIAIKKILEEEESTFIHGYNKSNSGYEDVRQKVASHLNSTHETKFSYENIVMTVGAAAGLNVILKTLLDPKDEVIAFAPYFVEYKNYVANYDGLLKVVPPETETFQPNLLKLESLITEKTKAVIINSPNNPTGVIYSEETLNALGKILRKKEKEYNKEIYLIADEPYRELAYDKKEVPYATKFYANTVVAYSWSKSLSLPGERIGYLVIPSEINCFEETIMAVNIANRILGFVNAPTLMQRAVGRCVDVTTDIEAYNRNRQALYEGLTSVGIECIKPEGAFYIFFKSPIDDEKEFCKLAKNYNILLVPGSSFDCPGYVRAAYCVSYDTIVNSIPKFKALMEEIS